MTPGDFCAALEEAAAGRVRFRPAKDGITVLMGAPTPIAEVRSVFDFWQHTVDKPRAVLNKARETKIRQRIKEGYTVDRLRAAIRGAMQDPFLRGDNDRQREYLDIVTILRDGPQVERLEALDGQPQQPKRRSVFRQGGSSR